MSGELLSEKKGFMREEATQESKISEQELVERSAGGDKLAYRALVERYQGKIFSVVFSVVRNREDAEDIVQETFVKAFLSLKNFKGASSFYTWIYRIAFNMSIDFKRKMARRGGQPLELNEEIAQGDDVFIAERAPEDPDRILNRKQILRQIDLAMQSLSDDHRTTLLLREIEGFTYDEIADITGVSKGTVMSRLHYARKGLQRSLQEILELESEPGAQDN